MASSKSLKIMKEITKRMKETNVFDRNLDKVKIISAGNGKCTAELTVEPEHTNALGTMHGGMSATLVDIISTYALMTSKKEAAGVSVDMHMTYMKAAKLGEEVLIEADTIRAGNTLAYLNVVIKNKKTGDLLVTGSHTKYIAFC